MDLEGAMWPEWLMIIWVLSDPPSHKVGQADAHAVIGWRWYVCEDGYEQGKRAQASFLSRRPTHVTHHGHTNSSASADICGDHVCVHENCIAPN